MLALDEAVANFLEATVPPHERAPPSVVLTLSVLPSGNVSLAKGGGATTSAQLCSLRQAVTARLEAAAAGGGGVGGGYTSTQEIASAIERPEAVLQCWLREE